jgi:hypothetical protein
VRRFPILAATQKNSLILVENRELPGRDRFPQTASSATQPIDFTVFLVFAVRFELVSANSAVSATTKISRVLGLQVSARQKATFRANSPDISKAQNRFDIWEFESLYASHAFADLATSP